jgi:hypothetical protein
MMRRSLGLALLLVLLAAPLATEPQPAGKVWRIGWQSQVPLRWKNLLQDCKNADIERERTL